MGSAVAHAAPATAPAATPTLTSEIDLALAAPFLSTATVGISVVDLADGKVLYQRGETVGLNPASNVKLMTTATALAVLGPEHRYATRIYRKDGPLKGDTIRGDIYLLGGGDPALVTENLYRLAGQLRAAGIRRITGGVVVDASAFDTDELPPGFDQKQELASYRAPSGACSINFNTFVVRVSPGASRSTAPLATVEPPIRGLTVVNEAKTVKGYRRKLFADLDYEDEKGIKIVLRGTIGVDAGIASYRYPVTDPSLYAGQVLASVLKQRGIRVGRTRIRKAKTPEKAQLMATHFSAPLSVLVRSINKFSNNFMAEQVLKTLADPEAPASFANALARERSHLAGWGIKDSGLRLGNGSGLYDNNRISAKQMTTLLQRVYNDFTIRADFVASLATMGVDGTTRRRLAESSRRRWVRAKTGTLDGISALSGYAGAPGRDPIAFSILLNNMRKYDAGRARAVQNRIAEIIALHAAGLPVIPDPNATQPKK